jgi:hypothetical protein
MQSCFICLNYIERVPLLRCGHFVCPECYEKCKNLRINNCSVCDKKMVRGCKKNK